MKLILIGTIAFTTLAFVNGVKNGKTVPTPHQRANIMKMRAQVN